MKKTLIALIVTFLGLAACTPGINKSALADTSAKNNSATAGIPPPPADSTTQITEETDTVSRTVQRYLERVIEKNSTAYTNGVWTHTRRTVNVSKQARVAILFTYLEQFKKGRRQDYFVIVEDTGTYHVFACINQIAGSGVPQSEMHPRSYASFDVRNGVAMHKEHLHGNATDIQFLLYRLACAIPDPKVSPGCYSVL